MGEQQSSGLSQVGELMQEAGLLDTAKARKPRNRGTQAPPVTPKAPREPNGPLLKNNNLKVYHVRPMTMDNHSCAPKGMSIVYRMKNRNVIEIATSICHTVDTFDKHTGVRVAVEAFLAGRTAYIPNLAYVKRGKGKRPEPRPVDTLKAIFG